MITRVNPPTLPDAAQVGYSQVSVMEPGRIAWNSGQVALSPDKTPPPDDLAAQMRIVARNARAALGAIGAGPEHILVARCYVTDLTPGRLEALMPPLVEAFGGARPSLTGIGVAALAAPEFQVELELTARLPD